MYARMPRMFIQGGAVMQTRVWRILGLGFAVPAMAALAGVTHAAGAERHVSTAAARLDAALSAADADDLALDPFAALERGEVNTQGDFGDYVSDDWTKGHRAAIDRRLAALEAVAPSELEPRQRLVLDVALYKARLAQRAHAAGIVRLQQHLVLDPLFGRHLTFQNDAAGDGVAPFATLSDYEDGVRRLHGFAAFLDRSILAMTRGIAEQQVHHRTIAKQLLSQVDAVLNRSTRDSSFARPLGRFPAAIGPDDQDRLRREYLDVIDQRVYPAYRRLRSFLVSRYLPASRSGAPGLYGLKGGKALYAHYLEEHTSTQAAPDEIHRIGTAEVARIGAEIDRVRYSLGDRGSRRSFLLGLQHDRRLQPSSAEALLGGYAIIERRVRETLPRFFEATPAAPFEIRPIPAEQAQSGGGAYYVPGTPNSSRPGVFYVNTTMLPTRTTTRMTALFLHEAIPGHHLQAAMNQADSTLPALLRFGWHAGHGEGWALYCERLGDDMGLYDDPYQRLGRLDMEMARAVRLVVDTGLHAKGWSRERAIRYMQQHTAMDAESVRQEIDRYIVWPGQAVAYKVGERAILLMRQRAEQALGARFDLRAFHRQVLDTGVLPLAVLERKISDWVSAQ